VSNSQNNGYVIAVLLGEKI